MVNRATRGLLFSLLTPLYISASQNPAEMNSAGKQDLRMMILNYFSQLEKSQSDEAQKQYDMMATQLQALPLTEDTFAIEDELIAKYQRHVGNLQKSTDGEFEGVRCEALSSFKKFIEDRMALITHTEGVSFLPTVGYEFPRWLLKRHFHKQKIVLEQIKYRQTHSAYLLKSLCFNNDDLMSVADCSAQNECLELYTWIRANNFEFVLLHAQPLATKDSEMAAIAEHAERGIREIDRTIATIKNDYAIFQQAAWKRQRARDNFNKTRMEQMECGEWGFAH